MFALTRKTDYALIALSHMAQHPGAYCCVREIADRYNVPFALLTNVLKTLTHGELVRSMRGSKGGYLLARPPASITLSAIIEAVEGPVRFVQCATETGADGPSCELVEVCPVSKPVRKVHQKLKAFLNEITLSDLAADAGDKPRRVALSVDGVGLKLEPIG
jgi:Rrf2 family protein